MRLIEIDPVLEAILARMTPNFSDTDGHGRMAAAREAQRDRIENIINRDRSKDASARNMTPEQRRAFLDQF